MDYTTLDILAFISILSSILVIINKNPIISVLFLIGLFLSIACYLIMIGLSFIGLSYLLVYIGAVSILFLFILMLINIRISELQSNNMNSLGLSIMIAIFFNYPLSQILPNNILLDFNNMLNRQTDNISFVTSISWENYLLETSHISSIGNVIYTNYSM